MRKNVQLKPVRIETELHELIQRALSAFNENPTGIKLDLPDFRRLAYKAFAQKILTEGLKVDIKPRGSTKSDS